MAISSDIVPKCPETTRNFIRGGMRGYLVLVCIPVQDIPPVPVERNRITNFDHNYYLYHEVLQLFI
jgi:hypothetical protein